MADTQGKGVNPLAAGAMGAVVGAVAGAAAVAMTDEENRKKVTKAINKLKTEGNKRLSQIRQRADRFATQAEHRIAAGRRMTKKRMPKV